MVLNCADELDAGAEGWMSASEVNEAMDSASEPRKRADVCRRREDATRRWRILVGRGGARTTWELRKRAKAAGVADDALEEATDADDPKAAVISLLLETALRVRTSLTLARPQHQPTHLCLYLHLPAPFPRST